MFVSRYNMHSQKSHFRQYYAHKYYSYEHVPLVFSYLIKKSKRKKWKNEMGTDSYGRKWLTFHRNIRYPPFTMGIRKKRNMNILYSSESTIMRIFSQKSKLVPNQEMWYSHIHFPANPVNWEVYPNIITWCFTTDQSPHGGMT